MSEQEAYRMRSAADLDSVVEYLENETFEVMALVETYALPLLPPLLLDQLVVEILVLLC